MKRVFGILSIAKRIVKRLAGLLRQEGIKVQEQNGTSAESIAVIVHELRTLVTPLRASGELLFEELGHEPDSPKARLAQNIVAGANCLEHWLSEMQELMKSETGLLEVKLETVAPLTVLREVAFVCLPMIKLKKQSLILDLPSSLPRVRADAERLQEILLNLLTNASRFTSEKGEIVLRARAKGAEVTVEVQDNGIGIPQDKREHLFESRFRTRSQPSEGYRGLGLGLAVCQQLVQQHGGRIWVDSEPGRGSTFAFTLPVEEGSIEGLSN